MYAMQISTLNSAISPLNSTYRWDYVSKQTELIASFKNRRRLRNSQHPNHSWVGAFYMIIENRQFLHLISEPNSIADAFW